MPALFPSRKAILAGIAFATGLSVITAVQDGPAAGGRAASAATLTPFRDAAAARDGVRTAAQLHGWGTPVASDDFGGTQLDRRAWVVYNGPGNAGKGRRDPRAVSVADGALKITGRANGTTGGVAWVRGSQKRGRWEARLRVNRACACYNANMLLWPLKGGNGGGEVDYMETYGDSGMRTGASFFLHYGPKRGAKKVSGHTKVDLRDWHVFAVQWTGKSISGFLDGRQWFRTAIRAAQPPGAMGQTIQLDWFPDLRKSTAKEVDRSKSATLEVDWIRMYRP